MFCYIYYKSSLAFQLGYASTTTIIHIIPRPNRKNNTREIHNVYRACMLSKCKQRAHTSHPAESIVKRELLEFSHSNLKGSSLNTFMTEHTTSLYCRMM